VAPLERARAAAADFSRPVFVAAAFYLAARSQKVSINRPQLCAAVGIASAELSTVVAAMEELCADLLGLKPAKTAASKRKRETVASPHATSPSPRKSPRRASAAAVG
jgi:origin recognition complex subunit 6